MLLAQCRESERVGFRLVLLKHSLQSASHRRGCARRRFRDGCNRPLVGCWAWIFQPVSRRSNGPHCPSRAPVSGTTGYGRCRFWPVDGRCSGHYHHGILFPRCCRGAITLAFQIAIWSVRASGYVGAILMIVFRLVSIAPAFEVALSAFLLIACIGTTVQSRSWVAAVLLGMLVLTSPTAAVAALPFILHYNTPRSAVAVLSLAGLLCFALDDPKPARTRSLGACARQFRP